MKKVFKILLVILLVVLLILGALVIWQWDNIKTFKMSLEYTPEDIETLVVENDNKIDDMFTTITDGGALSELTEEEKEKLRSGDMTEEEIEHIKEVLEASPPASEKEKDEAGKAEEKKDTSPSRVNEIISKIYVLRADFVRRLNALEGEAVYEKNSTKKSSFGVNKILSFAEKYLNRAKALEAECDSKMEAYIAELEAELKRLGQDTSMISEVRSAYKNEKQLKKSQLLNKYSKYLK